MQRNIGCLLVCSDPAQTPIRLRGLLTDRDLVVRVIAAGFNADATRVCYFHNNNKKIVYNKPPLKKGGGGG